MGVVLLLLFSSPFSSCLTVQSPTVYFLIFLIGFVTLKRAVKYHFLYAQKAGEAALKLLFQSLPVPSSKIVFSLELKADI